MKRGPHNAEYGLCYYLNADRPHLGSTLNISVTTQRKKTIEIQFFIFLQQALNCVNCVVASSKQIKSQSSTTKQHIKNREMIGVLVQLLKIQAARDIRIDNNKICSLATTITKISRASQHFCLMKGYQNKVPSEYQLFSIIVDLSIPS